MNLSKSRLEFFSDGVIAIIITVMVLEIPLPTNYDSASIIDLLKSIFIFFTSFFIVGIFWNHHHILFDHVETANNQMVWRNHLFLFALSLIPLFTKWVIENFGEIIPAIGYALVYLLVNIFYMLLLGYIADLQGRHIPRVAMWGRILITILLIAGVIGSSLFIPRTASSILIGLPLASSLFNIHRDKYHRENPHAYRSGSKHK